MEVKRQMVNIEKQIKEFWDSVVCNAAQEIDGEIMEYIGGGWYYLTVFGWTEYAGS